MSINLNYAAGSVPMTVKMETELFRNPADRGSVEERNKIEECKNFIRKTLGCIDEDRIFFLPSASAGITMVMNTFDTVFASKYVHHAVVSHPNFVGYEKGELYVDVTVNAETGKHVLNRTKMKNLKSLGIYTMLDISQSVGKEDFCFSREDIDYCVFSTSKLKGWRGGVLIAKAGAPLKPLVYGSQQEELIGGTESVLNAVCCADSLDIEKKDYADLWYTACDYFKDEKYKVFDSIHSTFAFVVDCSTEIVRESLIGQVDFSVGSACTDGTMSEDPWKEELGVEGLGLVRLSFGPETTEEEIKEGCRLIKEKIEEII